MGKGGAVLTLGRPLPWAEARDKLTYVRQHGVAQFVQHYRRHETKSRDTLMYGDEIEYGLFTLSEKGASLSLRGDEVRSLLSNREAEERRAIPESGKVTWHPEYGSWMVESTPMKPYSGYTDDLRRVESSMRSRRARLLMALNEDEVAPTVVAFPLLGASNTSLIRNGPVAASVLVPDEVINPHPRFGALTKNIRERRGSTVEVIAPLFRDEATEGEDIKADAMAFGMGCCCLQVTFQCRDVDESRHVYDQLAVIAPIMMALTAACPILAGKLQDHDVRWDIVSQSVDDRTLDERRTSLSSSSKGDKRLAGSGVRKLRTSRYAAAPCYMCRRCDLHSCAARYNDVEVEVDEGALRTLKEEGIDDLLAAHVAHLFVRDPLVIFDGLCEEVDDTVATDHFENLQSTNWNSVRWKPPPVESDIGWRVELRTMEVQLTDFENAAFTVFCVLVLRVLLSFDLNIYVPMSRVHENMDRAHSRNAASSQKFWWRSHMVKPDKQHQCPAQQRGEPCAAHSAQDSVVEMTLLEILTGKGGYYPGLVPLVLVYLDSIGCDPDTQSRVQAYVDLIVKRASGELQTAASWQRDFIRAHPDYKKDSVVSPLIAKDLLQRCHDIGVGDAHEPSLLGLNVVAPIRKENAYNVQLSRVNFQTSSSLCTLLDQYAERALLVKKRKDCVEAVARLRSDLDAKEKELVVLNDQLEPKNGLPRSQSLSRLHSQEGENLAVTLQAMGQPTPAAGDGA